MTIINHPGLEGNLYHPLSRACAKSVPARKRYRWAIRDRGHLALVCIARDMVNPSPGYAGVPPAWVRLRAGRPCTQAGEGGTPALLDSPAVSSGGLHDAKAASAGWF